MSARPARPPRPPDGRPTLLRDQVYRRLREEILSCRLRPGQEMREQDLAARFAVSKSPVHDALARLEREGLVTVLPRQGYRVAPVSLADARDIFRFRALLEAAAVTEAARTASDEELRGLARFRRFSARAFPGGFVAYNRAFHGALADLSRNRRLAAAARDMIEQMDRLVQVSLSMMEARDPSRLAREHAAIVDALRARDGKRAARLVRAHIADAERRVAAALDRFVVVA